MRAIQGQRRPGRDVPAGLGTVQRAPMLTLYAGECLFLAQHHAVGQQQRQQQGPGPQRWSKPPPLFYGDHHTQGRPHDILVGPLSPPGAGPRCPLFHWPAVPCSRRSNCPASAQQEQPGAV